MCIEQAKYEELTSHYDCKEIYPSTKIHALLDELKFIRNPQMQLKLQITRFDSFCVAVDHRFFRKIIFDGLL